MEWVKLGDIAEIRTGKLDANAAVENGKYPFFTTSKEILRIDDYAYNDEVVLVAGNGDLNVKYYSGKFNAYQRTYILTKKQNKDIDMRYLYYFLSKYIEVLRRQSIGGVIKYIKLSNLTEALVPLLDFEEQGKIIKKFNYLETLIAKRREQIDALDVLVESVFQGLLDSPNLKEVVLNDVILDRPCRLDSENEEPISYFDISSVNNKTHDIISEKTICKVEDRPGRAKQLIQSNDILVSNVRPNLKNIAYFRFDSSFTPVASTGFTVLRADSSKINPLFLYSFAISDEFTNKLMMKSTGANYPAVSEKEIRRTRVPLPKLEVQNRFADYVTSIEAQKESLRASLSELETLFDALMQAAFSGHLN